MATRVTIKSLVSVFGEEKTKEVEFLYCGAEENRNEVEIRKQAKMDIEDHYYENKMGQKLISILDMTVKFND